LTRAKWGLVDHGSPRERIEYDTRDNLVTSLQPLSVIADGLSSANAVSPTGGSSRRVATSRAKTLAMASVSRDVIPSRNADSASINGIPFEVKIPNELTRETLEKAERGEDVKESAGVDELFEDLGI
jgi:hypothetical protein